MEVRETRNFRNVRIEQTTEGGHEDLGLHDLRLSSSDVADRDVPDLADVIPISRDDRRVEDEIAVK